MPHILLGPVTAFGATLDENLSPVSAAMVKKKAPSPVDTEELRRYRAEARRRSKNPTLAEQAKIAEGARELLSAMEEARLEEARRKLH